MKIITKETIVPTQGNCQIVNVTDIAGRQLADSKLKNGNCTVFIIGSTASVTTIEYEPGLMQDFPKLMDKLIPAYSRYFHNDTWGDNNGHSHLRASLVGASVCIPFTDSALMLGTWQQIVLIDFDGRPRNRRLVIQLIGE